MAATIDGKAITAVFTQPRSDGSFPSGLAGYLHAISQRRPVLLFAFAPKAAGTFLRSAAIDAVGGQLVRISYAQGGRDAQPYLPVFVNYYLGGVCDGPMVAHAHMQALPANRFFLEVMGIRPVIMLRPIPDMLASFWDMLAESAEARADGLNCAVPDTFPEFSDAQKADFMIDMVAPWYVSYFATWLLWLRDDPEDVCVLRYEDFGKDPAASLEVALKPIWRAAARNASARWTMRGSSATACASTRAHRAAARNTFHRRTATGWRGCCPSIRCLRTIRRNCSDGCAKAHRKSSARAADLAVQNFARKGNMLAGCAGERLIRCLGCAKNAAPHGSQHSAPWNRKPIATSPMTSKSSRRCSARSLWTTKRWSGCPVR
jgi:hypothetical protein